MGVIVLRLAQVGGGQRVDRVADSLTLPLAYTMTVLPWMVFSSQSKNVWGRAYLSPRVRALDDVDGDQGRVHLVGTHRHRDGLTVVEGGRARRAIDLDRWDRWVAKTNSSIPPSKSVTTSGPTGGGSEIGDGFRCRGLSVSFTPPIRGIGCRR